MRWTRLRTALLAGIALGALAFAACGGDVDANSTITPATTVPSTPATPPAASATTSPATNAPIPTANAASPAASVATPQSATAEPTRAAPTAVPPTTVPTVAPTPIPPTPTPPPSAPLTATVSIGDNFFGPGTATIAAGGAVTWNWNGTGFHDVSGSGFESAVQKAGSPFIFTFTTPGTYPYVCQVHARSGMRGTIIVQ